MQNSPQDFIEKARTKGALTRKELTLELELISFIAFRKFGLGREN